MAICRMCSPLFALHSMLLFALHSMLLFFEQQTLSLLSLVLYVLLLLLYFNIEFFLFACVSLCDSIVVTSILLKSIVGLLYIGQCRIFSDYCPTS